MDPGKLLQTRRNFREIDFVITPQYFLGKAQILEQPY